MCIRDSIKAAPMGDPIEYRIWGYELTLRKDDGVKIEVELVEKREGKKETGEHKSSNFTNHPHIGESGIYHVKPVSYTHLDVYKRQVWRIRNMTWMECFEKYGYYSCLLYTSRCL